MRRVTRREPAPSFAPGDARAAHEARWTEGAYALLQAKLAELPVNLRAGTKRILFAAVRDNPARPAGDVLTEKFGALFGG